MKTTGHFIKQYLSKHGEAYPYQIFKTLKTLLFPETFYQNIRNYFYWLKKLGLIEFCREEPSEKPFFKNRRYYKLTDKGLKTPPEAPEWSNPRRTIWPESWEKHH